MIVRVKCFTGMRRLAPVGRNDFKIELGADARVTHLLERLGVPPEIEPIAAVNGTRAKQDTPLHDGDTIVLFTPMDGG